MASVDDIIAAPGDAAGSLESRLAHAREAKALRAQRDADAAMLAEVERFELIERLETELNGREGRDFAVIDVSAYGEGFIAVKLGPAALFKAYMASDKSEMHNDAFLTPCVVHPTIDRVRAIIAKRLWISTRIVNALAMLNGIDAEAQQGK